MTPVVGTGTSGYNGGSASPATGVQVNRPGSLSVTLDGLVVFADTGNHLIRAYDPALGTVIDDIAGVAGTGGYNGDGRDAQHTQLNAPRAVTAMRGALYVAGHRQRPGAAGRPVRGAVVARHRGAGRAARLADAAVRHEQAGGSWAGRVG